MPSAIVLFWRSTTSRNLLYVLNVRIDLVLQYKFQYNMQSHNCSDDYHFLKNLVSISTEQNWITWLKLRCSLKIENKVS